MLKKSYSFVIIFTVLFLISCEKSQTFSDVYQVVVEYKRVSGKGQIVYFTKNKSIEELPSVNEKKVHVLSEKKFAELISSLKIQNVDRWEKMATKWQNLPEQYSIYVIGSSAHFKRTVDSSEPEKYQFLQTLISSE